MKVLVAPALVVAVVLVRPAAAQDADPGLLAEIARVRAIDNHSHGMPASPPGALPPDALSSPPFLYPARLRLSGPEYPRAWAALWGVRSGTGAAHAQSALEAKWRVRREKGEGYPAWVLDQAGIDRALVNNDVLGPGQSAPRFLWVPTADALVYPREDKAPVPPDLAGYLAQVVTATLERWKAQGAPAVKFTLAYRRPLDFAAVPREEAARAYTRGAGETLSAADGKPLQDYLFRFICAEAGRLGLVVHVHVGIGADPYFGIGGSNPLLLEPTVNDKELRETRFVLIHGGWPFEREAGVMLIKPNVYVDFSAQAFLRSTRALSATLREWLEWYPEKVLFGTDAYDEEVTGATGPFCGWEEKAWLTTDTARRALALALGGMMRDGQVTRAEALDLARLVLRGNAESLYGWRAATEGPGTR